MRAGADRKCLIVFANRNFLAQADCTFLSDAHPHARDMHITFEASTHVYQIMGRRSLGRVYVDAVYQY